MKELLRSNDVVRLSWAQTRLGEAGIDCLVLDHHTSLVEGSIGAIPRRLMVPDRDHRRARAILAEAEEAVLGQGRRIGTGGIGCGQRSSSSAASISARARR